METPEQSKKVRRPRGKARLLDGKCIACGARCQSACPADAIEMNDKGEPIVLLDKCIGCQKCVKVCPATALEMFFTPDEQAILDQLATQDSAKAAAPPPEEPDAEEQARRAKIAAYQAVWVFVEQTEGEAAKVSWELLGVGAELAKSLDTELCAVVIGHDVEHLGAEAFAYGAQKVYLVDAPVFRYYRTQSYLDAVCTLVQRHQPEVVLMGATGLGRDLAGAVATRLQTGLTADCTGLAIDDRHNLMQTRPAFGGNIMATILCEQRRPQMATVRPHVMQMPDRLEGRSGEIVRETCDIAEDSLLVKVLEIIDNRGEGKDDVDITGADVLVSGGRGMKGPENYHILQELADELGGVLSASRSAVDAGWMPVSRQVGQTGKTVRPKIYIACGISGAIQHLVGMQDSDLIIAINRDKDAPIFQVATYGIVGDLFEVVPAITKRIREIKDARKSARSEAKK